MALETLLVGLREDWKGEGDYGCQNGCSKEGLVDGTEIEICPLFFGQYICTQFK